MISGPIPSPRITAMVLFIEITPCSVPGHAGWSAHFARARRPLEVAAAVANPCEKPFRDKDIRDPGLLRTNEGAHYP